MVIGKTPSKRVLLQFVEFGRIVEEKEREKCMGEFATLRRRKVSDHKFPMEEEDLGRFRHDTSRPITPNFKSRQNMRHSNCRIMFVLSVLFLTLCSSRAQEPTNAPVRITSSPTSFPTFGLSNNPTTATPTLFSTTRPTVIPTSAPQTRAPTGVPTVLPSNNPTVSIQPSLSFLPSLSPTASPQPSASPTSSPRPSFSPTLSPTASARPTSTPSNAPTVVPTAAPSNSPSSSPSYAVAFTSFGNFRIPLLISEREIFNATEISNFEQLMTNYTYVFAPNAISTTSLCRFRSQTLIDCSTSDPRCTLSGVNVSDPNSQEGYITDVDFFCNYTSRITNVTNFPSRLTTFTDQQNTRVTNDMKALGLPVLRTFAANPRTDVTARPTTSPVAAPSVSPAPTKVPTGVPTPGITPTVSPTLRPSTMIIVPPIDIPTDPPVVTDGGGGGGSAGVISGIVVSVGIVALAGLFLFYRNRMKKRSFGQTSTLAEEPNQKVDTGPGKPYKVMARSYDGDNDSEAGQALISPSESLVSKQSLVSHGSPLGDESDAEADGTKNLQDEFDQYKDQNLEELRSNVEGNMPGFEGVMSAAVTRALMDEDELQQEITPEVTWGCEGNPTGPEIEASVLCEVNDWIKRNEGGTIERKRLFMQDVLNRMVTSVRFGVVQAEDASRTIHESAALLGLQLANELPMTTVIISGMRKTAAASHMIAVLQDFGEIDVAAVASRQKGFGIVRFRHPKHVEKVMRRYRSGEIVIQDVAVQIKALMPSGSVEGRNG